ncbi:MAG: FtsK/SpoIIIE domain-containing protein [Actinomycetota bacterium]
MSAVDLNAPSERASTIDAVHVATGVETRTDDASTLGPAGAARLAHVAGFGHGELLTVPVGRHEVRMVEGDREPTALFVVDADRDGAVIVERCGPVVRLDGRPVRRAAIGAGVVDVAGHGFRLVDRPAATAGAGTSSSPRSSARWSLAGAHAVLVVGLVLAALVHPIVLVAAGLVALALVAIRGDVRSGPFGRSARASRRRADAELARRWDLTPSIPELAARPAPSGSADELRCYAGVAPLPWGRPTDARRVGGTEEGPPLPPGPVILDLPPTSAVQVLGARPHALAVARALIAQLCSGSEPGAVSVQPITEPSRVADWAWCTPPPGAEDGAAPLPERPPTTLLVVDGGEAIFAPDSVARRLLDDPELAVRAIVLAPDPGRRCEHVVEVGRAAARVTDRTTGSEFGAVLPVGLTETAASRVVHRLGGPGTWPPAMTSMPIELVDLLDGPVDDPEWLRRRWAGDTGELGPLAVVGVAAHGPLTIDLANDGPHVVVAGGSAASRGELLRSMAASLAHRLGPDRLHLVLIDAAGRGTFDSLAPLPHVVSHLVDLDDQLRRRTLRCILAELRHRRRLLRSADLLDDGQHDQPGATTPRLVIAVDGAELFGDQLRELVESEPVDDDLRLHLLVATGGDVRHGSAPGPGVAVALHANTDVVDVRDGHDASASARGELRRATKGTVTFRTATVGGGAGLPHPESPLAALTEAARTACADRPAPRPPWPDPLPVAIDAEALLGMEPERTRATPIGVADRPAGRRYELWWWTPEQDGHLVAHGADAADREQVIATCVLGLARRHHPDELQLHVIDHGRGALTPLVGLAHRGRHVGAGETGRLLDLVEVVGDELDRRRDLGPAGASALPLVLLAIDDIASVFADLEGSGRPRLADRLEEIGQDGPAVGIVAVATAHDVPHGLRRVESFAGRRLMLRMAEPATARSFGLSPRDVPRHRGGRAVEIGSNVEVQLAHFAGGDLLGAVASTPRPSATRAAARSAASPEPPSPTDPERSARDHEVADD